MPILGGNPFLAERDGRIISAKNVLSAVQDPYAVLPSGGNESRISTVRPETESGAPLSVT
jgi:hypothetical protein